jgi:hypothetical protein
MANKNGMNWIRQEKRLAIYLRDGCACMWCGASIETGAQLTLDHILPRSRGGGNDAKNLITSCFKCNASRQDRADLVFAKAVAQYINGGVSYKDIILQIRKHAIKSLKPFMVEAKDLIMRRGSAAKALQK